MTMLMGDSGLSTVGTLKTITISQRPIRENSTAISPEDTSFATNLPTVETPGIGATFILEENDFPTITPADTYVEWSACVIVSGINNHTAAITVSAQPYRDNTPVQSTILNGVNITSKCWSISVFKFPNVIVGNELKVNVWANGNPISYDFCAVYVYPTRIGNYKAGSALKDFTFTPANQPNLTTQALNGINSTSSPGQGGLQFFLTQSNSVAYLLSASSGNYTFRYFSPHKDYNFYRAERGDLATMTSINYSHSSIRYYQKHIYLSSISYREVFL